MYLLDDVKDVNKDFNLVIDNREMKAWSVDLLKLERQIEELEIQKNSIRDKMIGFCEENGIDEAICQNHKISKLLRKGNIDYAKIPQLRGVDLEKYRKAATQYYKFMAR